MESWVDSHKFKLGFDIKFRLKFEQKNFWMADDLNLKINERNAERRESLKWKINWEADTK